MASEFRLSGNNLDTPDYLLRGVRPAITDAPASIAYGQDFSIALLEPVEISSACFIRLSAVTHAFDMSQRHVALDFSQTDTQIDLAAVNDPNLAAPGHYMLFVLDNNRVPSVAPIIQLVYAQSVREPPHSSAGQRCL